MIREDAERVLPMFFIHLYIILADSMDPCSLSCAKLKRERANAHMQVLVVHEDGELQCSYYLKELNECADFHLGKVISFKFLKVMVVAHDVSGSGRDRAVDELVVVGVSSDEIEVERRIDALDVGQ